MTKNTVALLLLALVGCTDTASPTPDAALLPPDPVDQCEKLAALFCDAQIACECSDANTCVERTTDACANNLTIVPATSLQIAEWRLADYQCVATEECVVWPNDYGWVIFDAMVSWPSP